MMHRNCVTDREVRDMWRDYQHVMKDGNPLGLSFAEYVAQRVIAQGIRFIYGTSTNVDQVPWYVASCAHQHPWGETCQSVTT